MHGEPARVLDQRIRGPEGERIGDVRKVVRRIVLERTAPTRVALPAVGLPLAERRDDLAR